MYLEYGRVKNVLEVDTKYGRRLVMNVKLQDKSDAAVWSEDLNNQSLLSKKAGDNVRLIKGARGSYTLVEDETSNGSTLPTQTYSQRNGNGHSSPSNDIEDILDLPVLSDLDKRNMMAYIRSQSKLLKFCYETICQDFPTLEEYDPRGARSLAISLLISANQARDKYMK